MTRRARMRGREAMVSGIPIRRYPASAVAEAPGGSRRKRYPSRMPHVIDYVELAVDDVGQAKAFYAKALGWTFTDYGPDYAGIQDPTRPGQEFGGLNLKAATARGDGVVAL